MSLSRRELKYLASLNRKKDRQAHQQCIVEGLRLCEEALQSEWSIIKLFITSEFSHSAQADHIFSLAKNRSIEINEITQADYDRITDSKNGQGVALLADFPDTLKLLPYDQQHNLLILDAIQDPGNLGTLLRSADWFGLRHVVLGEGTVEWTNPKVMRASMGAVFHLNFYQSDNLAALTSILKEEQYKIIIADFNGVPLPAIDEKIKNEVWALVLGNEAHGVQSELSAASDYICTIPGTGQAESLNVAIAGSILLYELTKNSTA